MHEHPPREALWQWLQDHLPGPIAQLPGGVQLALGLGCALIGAIVLLLVLLLVVRLLFRQKPQPKEPSLAEDLGTYPPLRTRGGDRRLTVEGVPVRLRLVALAPSGKQAEVDESQVEATLERILPGLGHICKYDKPRVRIWPMQLSYEGFTQLFQRNTVVPEAKGELSPWIVVAGRAKLGKNQVLVGLALQAIKPTTVGRLTVEAHEWESKLRVRVRE